MKYKIGDRIRHIDTGWIATVIGVDPYDSWNVIVSYDKNNEIKADEEYYVNEADIDFVDKKRVFLKRLSELLRDFDTVIYGGLSDTHGVDFVNIAIDNHKHTIQYFNGSTDEFASITANNIFDYDTTD